VAIEAGTLLSSPFFGVLSDRVGRRPVLLGSILMTPWAGSSSPGKRPYIVGSFLMLVAFFASQRSAKTEEAWLLRH
jgi:MFS family permease